jgi:hypothetical protein
MISCYSDNLGQYRTNSGRSLRAESLGLMRVDAAMRWPSVSLETTLVLFPQDCLPERKHLFTLCMPWTSFTFIGIK